MRKLCDLSTAVLTVLIGALLCLAYSSCAPLGSASPEPVQKEMGLLKQDITAFAELAQAMEKPEAAKVAGDLAVHVGLAEEALAAYLAGTGNEESVWAYLEGAQSILKAYAEAEQDDNLKLAAFAVEAALRRVQAYFPAAE